MKRNRYPASERSQQDMNQFKECFDIKEKWAYKIFKMLPRQECLSMGKNRPFLH